MEERVDGGAEIWDAPPNQVRQKYHWPVPEVMVVVVKKIVVVAVVWRVFSVWVD